MKFGVNSDQFSVNINNGFHNIAKHIGGHLLKIIDRECFRDDFHDLFALKTEAALFPSPNRYAGIPSRLIDAPGRVKQLLEALHFRPYLIVTPVATRSNGYPGANEVRFGGAERGRTAASQFCRLLP